MSKRGYESGGGRGEVGCVYNVCFFIDYTVVVSQMYMIIVVDKFCTRRFCEDKLISLWKEIHGKRLKLLTLVLFDI